MGHRADLSPLELASRMLAAGYSHGGYCIASVSQFGLDADTPGDALAVSWRGKREESAAKGVRGSGRASALHTWTRSAGVAALPSFSRDPLLVAAQSGIEAVPRAILRVYALEAWADWGLVERAAAYAMPGRHAETAARDAMARILWRVADTPKNERAKQCQVRASNYRALTNRAEVALRRWLAMGAAQYLAEHSRLTKARKLLPTETRSGPGSAPAAFRSESWWHPERLGTDLHPADCRNSVRESPPGEPARCPPR